MNKHSGLRLAMAFGVLIGILAGIGELGLRRAREINETIGDITDRRSAKLQLASHALALSNGNTRIMMEIFFLRDRTLIDGLLVARAENTKKISGLVAQIEDSCDSQKEKQLVAAVKGARKPYIDSYLRALHVLMNEKRHAAAEAVMVNETQPALVKYHAAWTEFAEFQKDQLDMAVKQATTDFARWRRVASLLILLAVTIALAIASFVVTRDIAERKHVEKALRESEQRFQSAFEHAGIGMSVTDLSGNWLQVNPALCNFLGYTSSELLATNFQAITHPDDLALSILSRDQLLASAHKVCQLEKRYIHKAGHTVWGLLTVSPIMNAEGKPVCFVAQIQDISKRKQAQDALQAAYGESELFINSVPSILIGTDEQGRITRWNLAATNTFALPASAVRGKLLKDCGIKWSSPNIEAEIDSWLRIEKGGRRSDLLFVNEGEQRFLGLSVNRVKFAKEKTAGLLITGVDITERKQLEEQLRQAHKLEAIGQLAAGIAHEINTPMQYVGDNTIFIKQSWSVITDLARAAQRIDEEARAGAVSPEATVQLQKCIEEGDLDYLLDEMPKAMDQSLEGVQRVAKIVRAMKEFSHPSSEEKTQLDINRAIETTITVARNEWKYVAEVETCFDPELPLVSCHAGEFNQVILNLLINAAHAIRQVAGDGSRGKGKIRVSTEHDPNSVEIGIQDTGCGIPEAIQSRIFEPFFTTKPVGQGTGQGLALAHTTIVKRHGGRLWFETVEGKGTTFFIRLPITPSGAES